MNLSKRLNAICNLVEYEEKVADIGCDHGKVIAKLFLDKKISFAYASDISAPSVKKAEELLKSLKINRNNYEIVVGDGFNNIKTNYLDLSIIAGMGGLEIINILKQNTIEVKNLILAPNNNEIKLRKFLLKNNYKILTDFVVNDNKKYYNIIKVEKGKQKPNKLELYFGKTNLVNSTLDFNNYLDYLETKVSNLITLVPFIKKIKYKKFLKYIKVAKNKSRGK